MVIYRNIDQSLEEYLGIFPEPDIVGPRQVGKTTLAKSLAENRQVHYLDLESAADRQKLSDPVLHLANYTNKLVILDVKATPF